MLRAEMGRQCVNCMWRVQSASAWSVGGLKMFSDDECSDELPARVIAGSYDCDGIEVATTVTE